MEEETVIMGLDEAGRGPVLGPMVIALVKAREEDLEEFNRWGLRDSKRLNRRKRNELYNLIVNRYEIKTVVLEAKDIDEMIKGSNLDNIEIGMFSKLINSVLIEEYRIDEKGEIGCFNKRFKIYIDACSSNRRAFLNKIKSKLITYNNSIEIIAEHKADDKYKIVSAASIVAKVMRDRIIDNYKKIYGEIGSGYPSDRVTINYLRNYIKEHGELPEIARKCWKTSQNMLRSAMKNGKL
ncbi:MAG TPA: ribonuclease HII [Methanothermococcus okinawensis]|uniref:Ribonuclease HII n=1 Tax=Methanothermococcus okinawensis TaxID=155863 RepID=A0A832ZAP9_9EURY|nr:ribonuclease HII [Methanococcaceae archaeon]HIP84280.1 ribonuclease HII [Methanothermococcus okinawensis]HIP91445.1 ribonuclease HII [Methanothermococcus okinawensis]